MPTARALHKTPQFFANQILVERVTTDEQREGLLEQILNADNLNLASKQVKRNKGAGGIDGMQVEDLPPYSSVSAG